MKDRFGLSWQVAPENIGQLVSPKDPAKAARAMKAMMGMGKIDIKALENVSKRPLTPTLSRGERGLRRAALSREETPSPRWGEGKG